MTKKQFIFTLQLLLACLFISSCKKESCKINFGNSVEYGLFTDDRDGKTYRTVKIGGQEWFAENLQFIGENPHHNLNCTVYGQLYSWNGTKDACPKGWHLPTIEEWDELVDFLGGKDIAGGKLKESGNAHWQSPNEGANNSSGFTALPAGGYDFNSGGFSREASAIFWSSSEHAYGVVPVIRLNSNSVSVNTVDDGIVDLCFSIRCIKD